jgi:REP element-mobilizing transposase RayT
MREAEKEKLRTILRDLEGFCCLQIITYAILSNHFHILVKVPKRRAISDAELVHRLGFIYDDLEVKQVADRLNDFRQHGMETAAEALKQSYTYRMFDISQFAKTLKQKFSQYYNRREGRNGPLWEQRFKSILVEGSEHALSTIAAYVDLNAVRAGLVGDPKDYRYCGYGEAEGGSKLARDGLLVAMPTFAPGSPWTSYGAEYRKRLYVEGGRRGQDADGRPLRAGFSEAKIHQVLAENGRLPMRVALRCRVRYFSDGLALGSREFVERIFLDYREQFSPRRNSGARSMQHARWGDLCTMRSLRLSPVSLQ